MLFSDADWITTQDIADEDQRLVNEIAPNEGINLAKCISRAIDDVGVVLLNDMKSFSMFPTRDGLTSGHMAALLNVGRSNPMTRIVLQQVVVDNQDGQVFSPIRTWALHVAIMRGYRAALNNNITDRYVARVDYEECEIRNKYYPRVLNDGVPVVYFPLSRPAASRDFSNTGVWTNGVNVTSVAGSGPGGSYDVAVTWVDQLGTSTPYVSYSKVGNGESAPSVSLQVTCAAAHDVLVDISTLIPPTGATPQEVFGIFYPRAASGWNIYCGVQGSGVLRLQNAVPVPIATKTKQFTPIAGFTGLLTGQRREDKMIIVQRFARV